MRNLLIKTFTIVVKMYTVNSPRFVCTILLEDFFSQAAYFNIVKINFITKIKFKNHYSRYKNPINKILNNLHLLELLLTGCLILKASKATTSNKIKLLFAFTIGIHF